MKTPNLRLVWTIPDPNMIWALGFGLLAASLLHALIAAPLLNDYAACDFAEFFFIYLLVLINLGNGALAAAVAIESLRRPPPVAASVGAAAKASRFIHAAVAAHAAIVLPTFLEAAGETWSPSPIFASASWTSLAGAAAILALLNRLRWDARFAVLGATASIAAFGCAVWYAPAIYGWDLRPLGWYAILVAAIPVLAFLAVFLRRAPVFRRLRTARYGLAAALFIALACAVGVQMASDPNNEFSESLRAALDSRPNQIRFSDLTGFEWDTVEIYGAYTYPKQISPAVREGADIVSLSYFGVDDGLEFAAFLRDDEVVYYEALWLDGYSFHFQPGSLNPTVLKPEDAVFMVEYDSRGYPELTLKAQAALPTPSPSE